MMDQNRDTTGWGVVGLILGLMSTGDLLVQALMIILFPALGWTLTYFVKREITYRFPPKEPKALRDENLD
jgi:hypothetical protein